MRELRLTPQARADLSDIRGYSLSVWDAAQARTYLQEIGRHMDRIATGDAAIRPADHLAAGYSVSRCQSHDIFCVLDERVSYWAAGAGSA